MADEIWVVEKRKYVDWNVWGEWEFCAAFDAEAMAQHYVPQFYDHCDYRVRRFVAAEKEQEA